MAERPSNYYDHLAAERLQKCYELATPAVQRYLRAEITHIRRRVHPGDRVLELGCGYGRVIDELAAADIFVTGIDLSFASLRLAAALLKRHKRVSLARMNALAPAFLDATFDVVCCPQNGIAAFQVDQRALIRSALRVTRPGGKVLFFSYADEFWEERLAWFRIQARYGLIGEIDEESTGNGTIVCRDGFRAGSISPARFSELAERPGSQISIDILEHASVICEITA